MKRNTIKLTAAAIALAAIAALSGCSGNTSEIDLSLIGGEANTESRTDSVDIQHGSSDNEEAEERSAPDDSKADEPVNSDTISGAEHVEPVMISDPDSSDPDDIADDDTPKEETSPDDVTTAPDLETASNVADDPDDGAEKNDPAVTVTTDRKDETATVDDQTQPTVTTASTTTHKQETKDPQENELDSDGFPKNPVNNQEYLDENGQWWLYDSIFGWGKWDGSGATKMEDFPDHGGDYFSGEKWLY